MHSVCRYVLSRRLAAVEQLMFHLPYRNRENLVPKQSLAASAGRGAWIVLPTYDEAGNLEPMIESLLSEIPDARVLVVDDNSPDGTGRIADRIAASEPRVKVLHRAGKEGLGAAYRAGFAHALSQAGCQAVVQMDCDFSHDPAAVPQLLTELERGAGLVLGSRYVRGGSTRGWGLKRRLISRGGSLFARLVLGLPYRDLTGGFKGWRSDVLADLALQEGYANGYGFQIEMTWRASRRGVVIAQVPITFRDRRVGQSKMSGSIIREALLMVVRLRWQSARASESRLS
jgi:dolichol-phosphate mannosyltransferase